MPWNTVCPDGTKSVKNNTTILQENTTYTDTYMNIDHYWGVDATQDGRHQQVTMKIPGVPPTPGLNMDSVLYCDTSTTQVEPFFHNNVTLMQLLGIRAYAVFNIAAGRIVTVVNSHNVASVTAVVSAGIFNVSFVAGAMASDNYQVLGGCIGYSALTDFNPWRLAVASGTSVASRKSTTQVIITTGYAYDISADPMQAWVLCFGG